MTCTHTAGGDCCNRPEMPCPDHFTTLLSALMVTAAADDRHGVTDAVADLDGHRWITPAVMTLCGYLQAFGPLPGETVEQAMVRVNTDVEQVPADQRAEVQPWLFRLGVLIRSALAGDGLTISDTLLGLQHDPEMTPLRLFALITSLARCAYLVLDTTEGLQPQTVATYACLGSQTFNPFAYSLLVPMAGLTDALRTDVERPDLATRIARAPQDEVISAVSVIGRVLGQLISPDGPMLFGRTGPAGEVTGILEWENTGLDHTLTRQELAGARAMRVGVSYARGEPDTVTAMFVAAGSQSRLQAVETVIGACSLLANMMSDYQTADR